MGHSRRWGAAALVAALCLAMSGESASADLTGQDAQSYLQQATSGISTVELPPGPDETGPGGFGLPPSGPTEPMDPKDGILSTDYLTSDAVDSVDADADLGLDPPVTAVPDESSPPGPCGILLPCSSGSGGAATLSVPAVRYRLQIGGEGWATIRNCPLASGCGYVLGNVHDGWTIDVTDFAGAFAWGGINGSLNDCGWVFEKDSRHIADRTSRSNCSSQGINSPASSFARVVNCRPGQCSDGTPVRISGSPECRYVTRYLNVHPLRTSTLAENPWSKLITPSTSRTFNWRYVTRDNRWVMGRYGESGTRWTFITRSCLPTLPGGPGGVWYP